MKSGGIDANRGSLHYHEFNDVVGCDAAKMIHRFLADVPGWFWGHKDFDESPFMSWCKGLDEAQEHPLFRSLIKQAEALTESAIEQPVRLLRVYANGFTAGLCAEPHQDSPDTGQFTFLYYPHTLTEVEGGETFFYDENREVSKVKRPIADTAALFDGRILHSARPPTAAFRDLRITVAMKLEAVSAPADAGGENPS